MVSGNAGDWMKRVASEWIPFLVRWGATVDLSTSGRHPRRRILPRAHRSNPRHACLSRERGAGAVGNRERVVGIQIQYDVAGVPQKSKQLIEEPYGGWMKSSFHHFLMETSNEWETGRAHLSTDVAN